MDRRSCPVIIRGVHYPSQVAAAKAIGVSSQAVASGLDRGAVDTVGFGRNWNKKRKVKIDGVVYDSHWQAQHALNFPHNGLTSAARRAAVKGQSEFKYRGHHVVVMDYKCERS